MQTLGEQQRSLVLSARATERCYSFGRRGPVAIGIRWPEPPVAIGIGSARATRGDRPLRPDRDRYREDLTGWEVVRLIVGWIVGWVESFVQECRTNVRAEIVHLLIRSHRTAPNKPAVRLLLEANAVLHDKVRLLGGSCLGIITPASVQGLDRPRELRHDSRSPAASDVLRSIPPSLPAR